MPEFKVFGDVVKEKRDITITVQCYDPNSELAFGAIAGNKALEFVQEFSDNSGFGNVAMSRVGSAVPVDPKTGEPFEREKANEQKTGDASAWAYHQQFRLTRRL